MLLKILGAVDLAIGLILILSGAGINIQTNILLIFGLVILAKSLLGFFQDIGSWVDFIGGAVLLVSIIVHVPGLLNIIIGITIFQKGVVSFL